MHGRLFRQPLVPVVGAEDARWVVPQPLQPMLKPGGHGALWKLMLDTGTFSWLSTNKRQAAIVRQIRWRPALCSCSFSPCTAFCLDGCVALVSLSSCKHDVFWLATSDQPKHQQHTFVLTNCFMAGCACTAGVKSACIACLPSAYVSLYPYLLFWTCGCILPACLQLGPCNSTANVSTWLCVAATRWRAQTPPSWAWLARGMPMGDPLALRPARGLWALLRESMWSWSAAPRLPTARCCCLPMLPVLKQSYDEYLLATDMVG